MLFKENADTIEEKPFDKWVPLTRGPFGYSIARSVAHQELFGEILVLCDKARIPLIALHFETGPGVIEASLHYCDAGGRGSSSRIQIDDKGVGANAGHDGHFHGQGF